MDPVSLVQTEVNHICETFGPFSSIWEALHKILRYYKYKPINVPESVIKHAVRASYSRNTYNRANESFKLKMKFGSKRMENIVKLSKPELKFLYKVIMFCRENKSLKCEETPYRFAKYIVGYVGGSTYANIKKYLEKLSKVYIMDNVEKAKMKLISYQIYEDKIKLEVSPEFYSLIEYMNFDFREFVSFFTLLSKSESGKSIAERRSKTWNC